ncbi:serine/threonine protein phosphatase [Kitasatospora paracochleata]|uniref:Serine/threonine protein phosphatase PrpC n=1 Tax=Kitasatospora paracochleata TaxID=58354 RepID=A0ABT1IWF2_9ACTN|nr:mucin-2 [Kitasatospora paracochleata]MCP2309238.1 serine/threonine protein phosphatase PrpC [Kitasatospora paracochleata]
MCGAKGPEDTVPGHATHQLTGTRTHQCDATATRATRDGGRAYVLLDGIGSNPAVRDWTRDQARRLADLTARSLQPHLAITRLREEIALEPGWQNTVPGACAVAAVTGPNRILRIAWIGDCRAYLLYPDGYLGRHTTDHNMRTVLEARDGQAPRWARNRITHCLGHPDAGEALIPDWTTDPDRTGTRLLLASDGCYEPIEDAGHTVATALADGTPADAAKRLVRLAIKLGDGNKDNATCLVADL